MPSNIYISASLLKDYLDCPRKVYYRLNFPETAEETPDMAVGNLVHRAIEKYWNNREGAFQFALDWMRQDLTLTEKYVNKASLCLDNFFHKFAGLLTENDQIEKRFKIPFGNSFIVGKMDRITETGIIIDWKTSTAVAKNIDTDVQFILYQYVYEQMYGKPPAAVIKANLIDGSITNYSRDKILEYSIINYIIPEAVLAIQSNTLPPEGLFIGKCARCPYKNSCLKDLGY